MRDWGVDKRWADQFTLSVTSVLGQVFIQPASAEEDARHNTDYVVFNLDRVRVACRIRRPEQLRFHRDFTIRCRRPSGATTELAKVLSGWGDYLFYGFSTQSGDLGVWRIGDLSVFRLWFHRECVRRNGAPPGWLKSNDDGSSDFRVYLWDGIPGFEIASGCGRFVRRAEGRFTA